MVGHEPRTRFANADPSQQVDANRVGMLGRAPSTEALGCKSYTPPLEVIASDCSASYKGQEAQHAPPAQPDDGVHPKVSKKRLGLVEADFPQVWLWSGYIPVGFWD